MNKLTILLIAVLSIPALAGAPSPLDRQESYFKQNKQHQIEILKYDHEMANLQNQVFDLQAYNKELRREYENLKRNPETVYIEREKEVTPWWVYGLGVVAFAVGALLF